MSATWRNDLILKNRFLLIVSRNVYQLRSGSTFCHEKLDRKISPMKFFSSSKVSLNYRLFLLSLLAYWLVSWRSNSMRGETTFSNKSSSSIQQLLGSLERVPVHFHSDQNCFCHFTFILDLLAFYFSFFVGGGSASLSSPSEVILSVSFFLMLKT